MGSRLNVSKLSVTSRATCGKNEGTNRSDPLNVVGASRPLANNRPFERVPGLDLAITFCVRRLCVEERSKVYLALSNCNHVSHEMVICVFHVESPDARDRFATIRPIRHRHDW